VVDVVYSETTGQEATIIRPSTGGPFPVVVYFHGGAWFFGDRGEVWTLGAPFLEQVERGWAVVSVDVRARSGDGLALPTQIVDAEDALAWVRSADGSAARLDQRRMVLAGTSSGGHVALLVATRDARRHASDLIARRWPRRLNAAAPIRGVVAHAPPTDLAASATGVLGGAVRRLLGCELDELRCAHRARRLSPNDQYGAGTPPLFLWHGTADEVVPVEATRRFVDRVRATPGTSDVWLIEVPGGRHDVVLADSYELELFLWWCSKMAGSDV
jgi:acetyl esterase/lipase